MQLQENLNKGKNKNHVYTQKFGGIQKIIQHRKGKSSSKKRLDVQDVTMCKNRFQSLECTDIVLENDVEVTTHDNGGNVLTAHKDTSIGQKVKTRHIQEKYEDIHINCDIRGRKAVGIGANSIRKGVGINRAHKYMGKDLQSKCSSNSNIKGKSKGIHDTFQDSRDRNLDNMQFQVIPDHSSEIEKCHLQDSFVKEGQGIGECGFSEQNRHDDRLCNTDSIETITKQGNHKTRQSQNKN